MTTTKIVPLHELAQAQATHIAQSLPRLEAQQKRLEQELLADKPNEEFRFDPNWLRMEIQRRFTRFELENNVKYLNMGDLFAPRPDHIAARVGAIDLREMNLRGAHFDAPKNWPQERPYSPDFRNALLTGTQLGALDLAHADFSGASMVNANLEYSAVGYAKFNGALLKAANFDYVAGAGSIEADAQTTYSPSTKGEQMRAALKAAGATHSLSENHERGNRTYSTGGNAEMADGHYGKETPDTRSVKEATTPARSNEGPRNNLMRR